DVGTKRAGDDAARPTPAFGIEVVEVVKPSALPSRGKLRTPIAVEVGGGDGSPAVVTAFFVDERVVKTKSCGHAQILRTCFCVSLSPLRDPLTRVSWEGPSSAAPRGERRPS